MRVSSIQVFARAGSSPSEADGLFAKLLNYRLLKNQCSVRYYTHSVLSNLKFFNFKLSDN
jgi:hypothetical protein